METFGINNLMCFVLILLCCYFDEMVLGGHGDEILSVETKHGSIELLFNVFDRNIDHTVASFCKLHNLDRCKWIFDDAMRRIYAKAPPYFTPEFVLQKYTLFGSQFNYSSLLLPQIREVDIQGYTAESNVEVSLSEILALPGNLYNRKSLNDIHFLLLVSHYNENLSWLKYIPISYKFIVASKTIALKTLFVRKNKGNEVSSYLTYLVKYYGRFPRYTLFLHGHNDAWHQIYPIGFILSNLKLTNEFQNINSVSLEKSWRERHMSGLKQVWKELFEDELGVIPRELQDRCCAQFVVHRDRLMLRSKDFYEETLDYVYHRDGMDEDGYHGSMSFYMEYIWHYVFGESAVTDENYNDLSGLRLDTVGVYGKMRYFL